MTTMVNSIKKTGYNDIDRILTEAHNLIQEGNELQKDIDVAVKYKPTNPFNSRPKRSKFKIRFRNN
ncbi:hypothetical protein [Neobacillus niacini]|uniref:hypothetical protein n=1 Tax=Neobacillus niacini TaxID=86668 RepID=UPI001C8E4210|nr:hypothetical protein [Neobacillus niacini]MBY0145072.1 hypothetical protein [Neobacillus niacini]